MPEPQTVVRAIGCSFGCGRPSDFVLVQIVDSTTQFLCTRCIIELVGNIVHVLTEADAGAMDAMIAAAGPVDQVPVTDYDPEEFPAPEGGLYG